MSATLLRPLRGAREIGKALGVSPEHAQRLLVAGKVPGARKPFGQWTTDPEKLASKLGITPGQLFARITKKGTR